MLVGPSLKGYEVGRLKRGRGVSSSNSGLGKNAFVTEFLHRMKCRGTENSSSEAAELTFFVYASLAVCVCAFFLMPAKYNIYSSPSISSHRENKNTLLLSAAPLPRQQPSGVQETSVLESRARFEIRKRQKRERRTGMVMEGGNRHAGDKEEARQ